MSGSPYEVTSIDAVEVSGPQALDASRLMSPYVWRDADGRLAMLVRAVDPDSSSTGSIWFATGDGLRFVASPTPVLVPGADPIDRGGCEDPTRVAVDEGCLVYYTGVKPDGSAQMLWAFGADPASLTKRGVAHASTATDRNTKEAAVERIGGRWVLLFEYSHEGHSRIGHAEGDDPAGPWREGHDPLRARPGRWDGWHLSTGPLLVDEPDGPTMFYNGANSDAEWSIGWVRFDDMCRNEVARGDEPLISAPGQSGPAGKQMAFAASAVNVDADYLWLYYTVDDRSLKRATLRRRATS